MQRTSVLTAVLLALTFGGFCRAEVSGWENHLSTDWVTKIIARDGKLYLATDGGLVIYDVNSGDSRFLDRTDGLADNKILGLAEHNGKVWLGGQYLGVSTYDSQGFRNYRFPFQGQSSFAFDDVSGKVYIGSLHDIYVLSGDQVSVYTPDPAADIHHYPIFNALAMDRNHTLWFGGYIFGYLTANGQTTIIDCDHSDIRDILVDADGNKWLATNRGLKRYDGQQFTSFTRAAGHLPSDDLLDIDFDAQCNLWMACGNTVVKYDGQTFRTYPLPTEYASDMVYSVAAYGDCVWVGTRRHGLMRLKDGAFTHVDICRNGLHTNILYDVSCADSHGNVFFVTEYSLQQYAGEGRWKHHFNSEGENEQSDRGFTPAVSAAAFDRQGRLWVAPWNPDTALVVISGDDTTAIRWADTPMTATSNRINRLAFDSHNNLWVGTNAGLFSLASDGARWTTYTSANTPMPGDWVTALTVDHTDRVWLSIYDLGLLCFDGQTWTKYDSENSPLPYNYISSIKVDSHNKVWMNNRQVINIPVSGAEYGGGLIGFDGTRWEIYDRHNSPVGSNCITDLDIDKDDRLWLAAWDIGLVSFDPAASIDKWHSHTVNNSGIANPWPIQVRIDPARDRVWLAHEASGGISSATINVYGGVDTTSAPTAGSETFYTLDGLRVTTPLSGRIHIVRDTDGHVSKRIHR